MVLKLGALGTVRWLVSTSFSQRLSGEKENGGVFYDRKQQRKYKLKKKYTMYIVRYKRGNEHSACSTPCANCTAKMKQVGIKKVVYCDVHGEVQKENMSTFNSNFLSSGYREYARKHISLC